MVQHYNVFSRKVCSYILKALRESFKLLKKKTQPAIVFFNVLDNIQKIHLQLTTFIKHKGSKSPCIVDIFMNFATS